MATNNRARGWCITINNPTDEDVKCFDDVQSDYMIYGNEVAPMTGTPHLQGYIYFKNPRQFHAIQKMFPRAHLTPAKGSPHDNFMYCSKDGNFHERGTRPESPNKKGGDSNRDRWHAARMAAQEGRFDDIDSDIYMRCYGTIKRIRYDAMLNQNGLTDTEEIMEWYWGKSGTGKSRKARTENPNAFIKTCNKWWDGYMGEDVVIIEDFDIEHKKLCYHLKIWGDRYVFPAEVKGGGIKCRPKKLIITSNYHPREIWERHQDLEPILRRFNAIEFV